MAKTTRIADFTKIVTAVKITEETKLAVIAIDEKYAKNEQNAKYSKEAENAKKPKISRIAILA